VGSQGFLCSVYPLSSHLCFIYFTYSLIVFNSIGNVDYIPGPYTNIIILPEMLSIEFNVSIIIDDILEGNKAFYLRINSSSILHDNVTTGELDTASVMILDDDRKYFDVMILCKV